jgi:hypothetical protein
MKIRSENAFLPSQVQKSKNLILNYLINMKIPRLLADINAVYIKILKFKLFFKYGEL